MEQNFWNKKPREYYRKIIAGDAMLADAYLGRFEKIREWLDDKPQLDEELYARLPELKEDFR